MKNRELIAAEGLVGEHVHVIVLELFGHNASFSATSD
jgi:hypothetical protein